MTEEDPFTFTPRHCFEIMKQWCKKDNDDMYINFALVMIFFCYLIASIFIIVSFPDIKQYGINLLIDDYRFFIAIIHLILFYGSVLAAIFVVIPLMILVL